MTEALQDGLDRLKQRSQDLKAAIAAKKREAARLQKKRSQALEQQLRSVRSRLSSQERKLRTRRLIVLGGLMEKEAAADLLAKLDRSLDRDQDRDLFGLPPKSAAGTDRSAPAASAPLEGWRPARLPDGSWGSLYAGPSPDALPQELVGLTIAVRARSGKSWDAAITEVVERAPDRLLVHTRKLGR